MLPFFTKSKLHISYCACHPGNSAGHHVRSKRFLFYDAFVSAVDSHSFPGAAKNVKALVAQCSQANQRKSVLVSHDQGASC